MTARTDRHRSAPSPTNGVELHVVEAGDGLPRRARPRLPRAVVLVAPPAPRARRRRLPRHRPRPARLRPLDPARGRSTTTTSSTSPTTSSGCSTTLGDEQAVFVGHDWGSMVVWQMALLHPERVAGVVRHERAVPPPRPDAAGAADAAGLRRQLLLHPLLPGARRGRRRARAPTPPRTMRRMLAGLTVPERRARRTWPALAAARRPRASSTACPSPTACPTGSARTSSTTTSPSSPAPASPAASTGTATSTATGSSPPQLDGRQGHRAVAVHRRRRRPRRRR